jgi:hypothetical protein
VKEACGVDVAEGAGPVDRLHNLLLAMTGRMDDDAINSARELLGVDQLDAAAEFLAGCLVAGRIPVSSTEQYQLRRVLDEVRSHHSLADRLRVVDSVPDEAHRFGDGTESDMDLLEALAPVAGRLDGVRALWCSWRVTPAGVTYGAVPRRILLAEVGPEGSITAAGYQLLEALRRAGIGCSVDVFSSGTELPQYHRGALASAHRVHLDMPVTTSRNGAARARAPRVSAATESASVGDGRELSNEPPVQKPPDRLREPEPIPVAQQTDTPPTGIAAVSSRSELAPVQRSDGKIDGSSNMRVPAAVDAKLTDRERNLLRKLHEELAQREQDREVAGRTTPRRAVQSDSRTTTMPGTGGFPPISAASNNYPGHGGQPHQPG